MNFYIRLAFTSGLALRIKGAAYFTKSQLSETENSIRHPSNWWMAIPPLLRREPKTTRPISMRLRMFYPISLSAFCPANSAFICSATGSALITPSATWRLRLLGASTRLCTTHTTLQPDVKSSIDSFNDSAAYRDAWIGLQNTYPLLERFVGGLATIFPGTSAVESHFSVMKYEKYKNRMSLTDASLKRILHAKQYRRMHSLKV
jgi:hypothetical protein